MTKHLLSYDLLVSPRFRIARHALLLLALAVIAFNQTSWGFQQYIDKLGNYIYLLETGLWVSYIVVAYLNIYVLIPYFMLQRKYSLYFIILSFLMILLLLSKLVIERMAFTALDIPHTYNYIVLLDNISYFALNMICISGISLAIPLRLWLDDRIRIDRLENERLQSEVDRMKERINPQFLFDILRQTSVLAKTNAPKASEMLFKLSELLRYELYDCNRQEVLLSSDIQFITRYLKLEQLLADDFEYTVSASGQINNLFIPPLLLIPLVQNILRQMRQQGTNDPLHISLNTEDKCIHFECRANNVLLPASEFSTVEQRLQLLYNNDYTLSMTNNAVELRLMLQNHGR